MIEDACQVAWVRLLHHRQRVHRETVMAWLARTAVREAVRLLRRDRREASLEGVIEAEVELPSIVAWRPRANCSSNASGYERAPAARTPAAPRLAACSWPDLRRDGRARRMFAPDRGAPATAGERALRDERAGAAHAADQPLGARCGPPRLRRLARPAALAPALLRRAQLARLGARLGPGSPALRVDRRREAAA